MPLSDSHCDAFCGFSRPECQDVFTIGLVLSEWNQLMIPNETVSGKIINTTDLSSSFKHVFD